MAHLEDLIARIPDAELRDAIAAEVKGLKAQRTWGLVFERHIPETARLLDGPLKVGTVVWERRAAKPRRLRVRAISGDELIVAAEPEGSQADLAAEESVLRGDVLVERDFREPVYPGLTPLGSVRNGPAERPAHVIIRGENFHALGALLSTLEGQVDLIYLDPPYNTGDKDWSYNNDYVDANDAWRPSKWLAFMERRLRLGRRLLKPDGVLVVTIDENEIHHLGMLLEDLFPDALVQMVTIAINPSGSTGEGFSRVDEYAYFAFFGGARPNPTFEDFFGPEDKSHSAWWERLMRRGSSWVRAARPNLCYPILVDVDGHIAGAGDPFDGDDESARPTRQGEYELAWPVRTDGRLGIWRVDADRLRWLYPRGYAVTVKRSRGTWSARYLLEGAIRAIESGDLEVVGRGPYGDVVLAQKVKRGTVAKTMWHRGRHAGGGVGGTSLVSAFLGRSGVFSYPKSVYAVRDVIDAAIGGRPDALIVDFFAGSGTTAHATFLLNAADGLRRRSILVTNNELSHDDVIRLRRGDRFRGDPEFEAHGVFEKAMRPRITAAVSGLRADEQPVEGEYLDGRAYAEGFEESVEFLGLDYLDPVAVEMGMAFERIHPLLWLAAGAVGVRPELDPSCPFALPEGCRYGILFNPSGLPNLLDGLMGRPDVTHVFIVADSDVTFADLASAIAAPIVTVHLYRRYLDTLRGAVA